ASLIRLGNENLTTGFPAAPRYPLVSLAPTDQTTMRLAFSAAFLAALAFAVPAHAAGLSGIGADLFGNYFHFPNKSNIAKPPVRGISAGPLHMQLQHTKLEQLRKLFGGTIRTQGSEKTLANWLCYHTDGSGKAPAAN